jgi:hypothetical protein
MIEGRGHVKGRKACFGSHLEKGIMHGGNQSVLSLPVFFPAGKMI